MFGLIQLYQFFSPITFYGFFHSLFLPNLGNPKFEVLIVVIIASLLVVIDREYAASSRVIYTLKWCDDIQSVKILMYCINQIF